MKLLASKVSIPKGSATIMAANGEEPLVALVVRPARLAGESAHGAHEEPDPEEEPDVPDVQHVVQPLVVEDRGRFASPC